jgi:hypothetical protein
MRGRKIVFSQSMKTIPVINVRGVDRIMTFIEFLPSKKCFSNIFNLEMKRGHVESPNGEITVSRVNYASSRSSGAVTEPGFVLVATITSGCAILFGHSTLVASTFHTNRDGIALS